MDDTTIRQWLVEAGLRKSAVDQLLAEYKKAQTRFQEGEYAEVGIHVGRFCEAVIHILRLEIGSELKQESVRDFTQECLHGDFAADYSDAINQHIPNMLNTAYDIRSNRDAAHLNLETAVNRADARLGIALCSSMLVELIREFVEIDDETNLDEITTVINQLTESVEENPLESLVVSRFDFDRFDVAAILENTVSIVDEDKTVEPDSDFTNLTRKRQVTALGLGRLAAHDLGYFEQVGVNESWYADHVNYDKSRMKQFLKDLDFFTKDLTYGGYHIPGHRVSDAVDYF
jgi:hypothetical protein